MPPEDGFISIISPLREESFSTTTPLKLSSTSTTTSSIGSCIFPALSFLNKTRGRETETSKPSRRIFSIKTPSCNSPRPPTSKASLASDSFTLMATLVSASAKRRSRIIRDVTLEPSVPANGESLTPIVIAIVGGSIGVDLIGSTTEISHKVSETEAFSSPAMETISPALASSTGTLSTPRNT